MSEQETNIDKLLKARAELDQEIRRHKTTLTILFTDLVGSTSYFDRFGDTAGVALVHRHSDLARTVFTDFRGSIIKTIGDSVMAEFPEPGPAVRAAIELQRRVHSQNETLPERDRLQVRIGINHGPVFRAGNDVFGDAVNVAARVCKHTGPAQILISSPVRDAIESESDIQFTWLDSMSFEGKAEKEDIFEVLWTDSKTYGELRARVAAEWREEHGSPGLRLEDFLPPEEEAPSAPSPAPASPGVASAEPAAPSPAPGPPPALTARYEILGEAGVGGMGVVYKAKDRETGELVALKVIKPEVAADQTMLERFKNELRLARKVTHKNVCRIHDFNRAEGIAYISMEYVEGESLRKILGRERTLVPSKALEIAQQVCAGLSEAHAQGIVHRDLKPENVMLDPVGHVKLMDFGVARSADTGMTQTGFVVGTPAYMAPEQAEGKKVDNRTDVYAIGLILYEMVTGRPAFSGESAITIALKQIREAPEPPHALNPLLPVDIEKTILRCLEKEPVRRFQSVDELATALTERAAGMMTPMSAVPHPTPTPARPTPPSATPRPTPRVTPAAGTPRPVGRVPTPIPMQAPVPRGMPRVVWYATGGLALGVVLVLGLRSVMSSRRAQPAQPPAAESPAQPQPTQTGQQPPAAAGTGPQEPAPRPSAAALTPAQQAEIGVLFRRARQAAREKNYDEAISSLEQILVIDPAHEAAREGLTLARRAKERTEQGGGARPGVARSRSECPMGALSETDVSTLVATQTPDARVKEYISQCGLDFEPTPEIMRRLRIFGASDSVLRAVQQAKSK